MPFKPWIRKISPLAWCLGLSALANVVTMIGVLYIALGTTRVYVDDGYITARVRDGSGIFGDPVRVQIVK
jgi:hypothetical protein